jgi:hypothetical protein
MVDGGGDLDPDAFVPGRREPDPWRARPFTVTNGRTEPSASLDLMTLAMATDGAAASGDGLGIDHGPVFELCRTPISVAEVAARLGMPVTVTKILLSDLVELGVLVTQGPTAFGPIDLALLEAVRDGLRAL